MKKSITAVALVAVASGCAFGDSGTSEGGEEIVSMAEQPLESAKLAAVPYPIQRDQDPQGGQAVRTDPLTGKPLKGWSASHAELLIADAYGQCVAEVAGLNVPQTLHLSDYPSMSQATLSLGRVETAITENPCSFVGDPMIEYGVTNGKFVYPPAAIEWVYRRTSPFCNMDEGGALVRAMVRPTPDTSSPLLGLVTWSQTQQAFYAAPPVDHFILRDSYALLHKGFVGLCTAQRVSSLLEDADALVMTTREHMLMLGVAQETAQSATMALGYLLKVHSRTNNASEVPAETSSGGGSEAYLWHWMNGNASVVPTIGTAFLHAVRLLSSTSTELATYLERQAGARWTTSSASDAFSRDWGVGSARNRLMSFIYGGGALTDLWGDVQSGKQWFGEVREQGSSPEVSVLFSLAREADGLLFRELNNGGIDPSTWSEIYLETEAYLRQRDCVGTETECSRATIRASLPPLANESSFVLRKAYGVTLDHAKRLATGLFDSVVKFDMLPAKQYDCASAAPLLGLFHYSGTHQLVNRASGAWIKLDPNGVIFPYRYGERADRGESVRSATIPPWDNSGWIDDSISQMGVVAALAFGREVFFELSHGDTAGLSAAELESVFGDLERLIGRTTIIQRPTSVVAIMPAAAATQTLVCPTGVVARSALKAAAAARDYSSPNGISRAVLDAVAPFGAAPNEVLAASGPTASLKRVTWALAPGGLWTTGTSLLLRTPGASGTGNDYTFLSTREQNCEIDPYQRAATVVTEGWFADLTNRITAVQDNDWSRPRYDGFGLPVKWVPPADASLLGGSAGEESYQYLLRSAKLAAEDATVAVKTAIDKLAEEAKDDAALQQAETRAESISNLERESLCGKSGSCEVSMTPYDFRIPEGKIVMQCLLGMDEGGSIPCEQALDGFNSVLPVVAMPEIVTSKLSIGDAQFLDSKYAGSDLQRVLTRIWNAGRLVNAERLQVMAQAEAYGHEVDAVRLSRISAQSDKVAALASLNELELNIRVKGATAAAQIDQLNAQLANAALQTAEAGVRVELNCKVQKEVCKVIPCYYSIAGMCLPFDGTSCTQLPRIPNNAQLLKEYCNEHRAYCGTSRGKEDTGVAAGLRCEDALIAYESALGHQAEAWDGSDKMLAALALGTDTELAQKTVEAQTDAAYSKFFAGEREATYRLKQSLVQLNSHYGVLQQTVGELFAALVELNQLQSKATQSKVRGNLEILLAEGSEKTNSSLRRKYRSYDQWRARALLESARRLAVAARRSIEARFVVDLSTLSAEQAFVASPNTWADEIYQSDLNAPEAVGLMQSSQIEGAIYPNKLVDYVGNLERFVQGYTITYPTSVSLPDTEVITLGSPEQVVTASGTTVKILSPSSAGWRFYCDNDQTWKPHPGVGQHPLVSPLETACNDRRPTRAKIDFGLDPWGVMNGAWARPRYVDRHNVRWRRLAVNIVGTGIRDCTKAADSMSCYTNPFIRFNIVHVGPSWQTNHAGEWRALDISTASIEAGKALAAEEWLEPVTNSWNMPYVSNVARGELFGRPAAGTYELILELTPDVQLNRIERIQLLVEQDYWVRQTGGRGVYGDPTPTLPSGAGGSAGAGGSTGTGGATATGGSTSSGGTTGSGGSSSLGGSAGTAGTTGISQTGSCTPAGASDPRIENFEDHNKVVGSFEQRLGVWYGFHAGTCTVSPPTNDTFVPLPSPGNGSAYAGYTSGSGCDAGNWQGGGIGFSFLSGYANNVETACQNYDASKYSGISFQAQGSGEIRVEVCTTDVETGSEVNCHGAYFTISGTWTTYSVLWSGLAQRPGWGTTATFNRVHLRKIQFLSLSPNYSFAVDNIAFTN